MSPAVAAATYTAAGAVTSAIIGGIVALAVAVISQIVSLLNSKSSSNSSALQGRNNRRIKQSELDLIEIERLRSDLAEFSLLASAESNAAPGPNLLKFEVLIALRLDIAEQNHSDLLQEVRRIVLNVDNCDRKRYFDPKSDFVRFSQLVILRMKSIARDRLVGDK